MLGVLLTVFMLWLDGSARGAAGQEQGVTPATDFARARDAVSKGEDVAVRQFLSSAPELAKLRDSEARTLLHIAAQRDRADIAALLLEVGADPNAKDARGETPLDTCLGVYAYRGKVAELLVARGAASTLSKERRVQLLHRGAASGQATMVTALVASGVDLRTPSPNGGSLLHSAAAGGLDALAQTLLESGLPVESRDRYGLTPLHYAGSRNGNIGDVYWVDAKVLAGTVRAAR